MKVYFIGAGPGAADLITVRGVKVLERVPMVMYAGSLVSEDILDYCKSNAEIVNTASLNLEEQMACYERAQQNGWDVARVHSGDPAIYGATAEQMRRLEAMQIPYEVVPGVSSFTAAASCLSTELTKPNVSQSIILTRTAGRASSVPDGETLDTLASHNATLCIFLSGPHLPKIVQTLREHYEEDTPIALIYKATWPEQRIHRSTLAKVVDEVRVQEWSLTTMMLVGDVLRSDLPEESKLYSAHYTHRFRKKVAND